MVAEIKTSNLMVNNSSSSKILSNRDRCVPKIAWEKTVVAHLLRCITHPVVAAISTSLEVMITRLYSQLIAKYLHSSADQTSTLTSNIKAVVCKLTIIMIRDTENNNNNKDSVRIQMGNIRSKMITTRMFAKVTNMTIIRPIIQISKNKNRIREITTIKQTIGKIIDNHSKTAIRTRTSQSLN